MKKQELVNTLQNGHDCFFSRSQVIAMLSDIEDAPVEDTKDKVWFTQQHLFQLLVRFRDAMVTDIESNVSASDLVRDEDCDIDLNGREIMIEVNSFNISEIESAVSGSVQDFLNEENIFS